MVAVVPFTRERISDVLAFERELRRQEPDTFFMDAGESYRDLLERSFEDSRFTNAVSMLAWEDGRVIGRGDAVILAARSDASCSTAYLDWICVLKEERHRGVAQLVLQEVRPARDERGGGSILALNDHQPG